MGDGFMYEPKTVSDIMHTPVHTIGSQQSLASAAQRMRELGCRHLPVLVGGRICGILSDRDIDLVMGLPGLDGTELTVEEAMVTDPFTVEPTAELAPTLEVMAGHKYGAAVVVEAGKVVGIVTTVDVLTAFASHLRGHAAALAS